LTGLLTTSGSPFQDWSAAYRLFSQDRLPLPEIFSVVRRTIADQLPPDAPFRAVLDDTLLRRSGLHVPGVAWRRDPLGPPFQTNFVRGQRFLQISAALPGEQGGFRLAPIAFLHTPTPRKPTPGAPAEAVAQYRLDANQSRLSLRATQQMIQLRQSLDQDGGHERLLILAFDGGYTNATVLKQIPPRTVCIGRIRKDARLCLPPIPHGGKHGDAAYAMAIPRPLPNRSAPTSRNPGKPSPSVIPASIISCATSDARILCGVPPERSRFCS
jgi:DDE superfamily endonuclease